MTDKSSRNSLTKNVNKSEHRRSDPGVSEAANYVTGTIPDPQPSSHAASQSSPRGDATPPPAYDSLFGQIKKAQAESKTKTEFLKRCDKIWTKTVFHKIFWILFVLLAKTGIVIGAVFFHRCPAQPHIPIFLIVHAVVYLLSGLVSFLVRKGEGRNASDKNFQKLVCTQQFIFIFLFAWFIFGNVTTHSTKWVSSPVTAENYCHPGLYYFTFVWLMIPFSIVGIALIVSFFFPIVYHLVIYIRSLRTNPSQSSV